MKSSALKIVAHAMTEFRKLPYSIVIRRIGSARVRMNQDDVLGDSVSARFIVLFSPTEGISVAPPNSLVNKSPAAFAHKSNGYHELLDAEELRRRNHAVNQQRAADGKPRLPETSRLLAAMDVGLPACTGVALGFDGLVMVEAGAKSIAEVIAFPMDHA